MTNRKRIAIIQSNYIPWKGYFDIINSVDEFILYDEVQYTCQDWRSRNRIKTANGLAWLTIPNNGTLSTSVAEVETMNNRWRVKHWRSISQAYARAAHFRTYAPLLEPLWLGNVETHLSRINRRFMEAICEILGIRTRITCSSSYQPTGGKTERIVDICLKSGATTYLSGPAAKGYLIPELFQQAGIALQWMDYSEYPEHPQLHPPFEHAVSIVDLILNTGPDATRYMKSFGVTPQVRIC